MFMLLVLNLEGTALARNILSHILFSVFLSYRNKASACTTFQQGFYMLQVIFFKQGRMDLGHNMYN